MFAAGERFVRAGVGSDLVGSRGWRWIALAIGALCLSFAPFWIFHPLPPFRAEEGTLMGTCGPGSSSISAIDEFLNPGDLGPTSQPDYQQYRDICAGSANRRLAQAGAAAIVGTGLIGAALWTIGARRRETLLSY